MDGNTELPQAPQPHNDPTMSGCDAHVCVFLLLHLVDRTTHAPAHLQISSFAASCRTHPSTAETVGADVPGVLGMVDGLGVHAGGTAAPQPAMMPLSRARRVWRACTCAPPRTWSARVPGQMATFACAVQGCSRRHAYLVVVR